MVTASCLVQLDNIKNLIAATGVVDTSNQHNSAQQLRKMISDNLMVCFGSQRSGSMS